MMNGLQTQPAFAVGLDVGGTKTEAIVVDQNTQIKGHAKRPTDTSRPANLFRSITKTVHDALQQAGATTQQIKGIGIGIPGLVNPKTGVVKLAANLNLDSYPLAEKMTAMFNAPTHLENDVRIAALGAYQFLQTETAKSEKTDSPHCLFKYGHRCCCRTCPRRQTVSRCQWYGR